MITVARTPEQLEQAVIEAEAWLDSVAPTSVEGGDYMSDLRAVTGALANVAGAEDELRGAVHAARAAGWSWGRIGMALGVSPQAAQKRFGNDNNGRR